jgi:DNA-binding PadR family transcriptional regulator
MNEETLSTLLDQWESVYKKGLLTFWVLLLLHKNSTMYAFEMGEAITALSQGTMSVEEASLYRALRRFEGQGFVESEWQASHIGPKRRYYRLSQAGTELLRRFTERNILPFYEPELCQSLVQLVGSSK